VENLYAFINKTQEKTEEKLKASIKEKVNEANNIALRIYNENKDTKSRKEIEKMIKDALVDIRFNDGRGYIFVYTFDYECILLPVNRKNEGGSVRDFQDSNGMYLGREIVNSLKDKDEAFLTWYYPKPNEPNSSYKKIGFNVHFKPYDWFIGTGEYFVDFENGIKKEVTDYVANFKTNENNYFIILDYNNNERNIFQKIDGLNNILFRNVSSQEEIVLFDNIMNEVKNHKEFVTYDYKLNGNTPQTKTSYLKDLPQWNWSIGKGFYHNYVEQMYFVLIILVCH
jgi:signal transduction histidine kinase